jgi:hypothetical protein
MGFSFGKFPAIQETGGCGGDMKSLWETKEKSGNETGQTINRMRLPL